MAARHTQSVTAEVDAVLGPAPVDYSQAEVVVLKFRRHGRALALPVLVLLAVAAASGFWVGSFLEPWMNLAAGAGALLVAVVLGVLPILGWLSRRTTVTTRRVISRRGTLVHHRTEVAWNRVREVRSRRGIGQRMFGSGNIELVHGAEILVLEDVPGSTAVTEALHDLMQRNFARAAREAAAAGGTQVLPSSPSPFDAPWEQPVGPPQASGTTPNTFWDL